MKTPSCSTKYQAVWTSEKVQVEFECSYEPTGPFGAKSIGEVVINTPLPAIADAIYNAIGTRFYELPITPEQVAMAVEENR